MEWANIVFTIIGIIGGAVGTKVVGNYLFFKQGNYTLDKNKRTDTLDEFRELIKRQREDIDEARADAKVAKKDAADARQESADCEARFAGAVERIGALEDALTNAGIKFRPWVNPGSEIHNRLKES